MIRYERERPGELIHVDIKKLGRIDSIGHRITGDRTTKSHGAGCGTVRNLWNGPPLILVGLRSVASG